jgi:hypothetical protein
MAMAHGSIRGPQPGNVGNDSNVTKRGKAIHHEERIPPWRGGVHLDS